MAILVSPAICILWHKINRSSQTIYFNCSKMLRNLLDATTATRTQALEATFNAFSQSFSTFIKQTGTATFWTTTTRGWMLTFCRISFITLKTSVLWSISTMASGAGELSALWGRYPRSIYPIAMFLGSRVSFCRMYGSVENLVSLYSLFSMSTENSPSQLGSQSSQNPEFNSSIILCVVHPYMACACVKSFPFCVFYGDYVCICVLNINNIYVIDVKNKKQSVYNNLMHIKLHSNCSRIVK